MSWILFTILASFLFALTNIVDKFMLNKLIKNPMILTIFTGVLGLITGIIVFFFHGLSHLSIQNTAMAIFAGVIYLLMILFYFKAASYQEISRIVPIFQFNPIIVGLLAFIFLGEVFSLAKYAGILLLVMGSAMISIEKSEGKFHVNKSIWLIILSTLALSLNYFLSKYLLNFADYWTIFSYERIGAFLVVIPLIFIYFRDFKLVFKQKIPAVVVSMNELTNIAGIIFITLALSSGPVTLVTGLAAVQPFFVLATAIFASIFFPKIIQENISGKILLVKIFAIILIFIGSAIVAS